MHLLRDQKAPPRCEVGGEKNSEWMMPEKIAEILSRRNWKHVEGLAQRVRGVLAPPQVLVIFFFGNSSPHAVHDLWGSAILS